MSKSTRKRKRKRRKRGKEETRREDGVRTEKLEEPGDSMNFRPLWEFSPSVFSHKCLVGQGIFEN
jgi:hypothetical protein